jgi:hypothetical protein
MKQRLLVMNGQRLVQNAQGGKWETVKVEKAGTVKPGIYDIHLSSPAEQTKAYDGPILHADRDYVYQQVRKSYIKHDRAIFDSVPDVGANLNVRYENGKAVVTVASIKLGRKI